MRRFAATQCSDKTVSIAEEHLDKAPESVLAIAARDSSLAPDSVVILKHWPDANVVILQVGDRVQNSYCCSRGIVCSYVNNW